MNILIRMLVLGFITVGIASYFVGEQANQQVAIQKNFQNEVNEMRMENEQKNCQQTIKAPFCTAPRDRGDRWICSERLAENHCGKYVDVGYLILDEHKEAQRKKDKMMNYPG